MTASGLMLTFSCNAYVRILGKKKRKIGAYAKPQRDQSNCIVFYIVQGGVIKHFRWKNLINTNVADTWLCSWRKRIKTCRLKVETILKILVNCQWWALRVNDLFKP